MMLLDLVVVGKLRSRELSALCAEFTKRLGAYARLRIAELADSDPAAEGKAICRELDRARGAKVVVLSEEGKLFSTVKFAEHLANCDTRVVFVVGGPFGLAPKSRRARICCGRSRPSPSLTKWPGCCSSNSSTAR